MPADQTPRLDPQAKLRLAELQTEGEPDIYDHLVTVFIESSDQICTALVDQKTTGSAREFREQAHLWKNNALGIGAMIMAKYCTELEAAAKAGQPSRIHQLVDALELEYQAVRRELLDARKAA